MRRKLKRQKIVLRINNNYKGGQKQNKMTAAGAIIGTVPTFQAAALLGDNVGYATSKKKKTVKGMTNMAVKNIVGANLITLTAQQASLVK